jgi:hypothetical protein
MSKTFPKMSSLQVVKFRTLFFLFPTFKAKPGFLFCSL